LAYSEAVPSKQTRSEAAARPLRADARRNQQRVLAAAREVFAERGEQATLAEVAARAGVGVGTVYRHYTNKAALIDDLFDESVSHFEQAVVDALAHPEPWDAFVTFIERMEEGYAGNRALGDLMTGSTTGDKRRALARQRMLAPLNELIERAKEAGNLRADFTAHDFEVIHAMLSAAVRETDDTDPGLWRRYFAIVIAGLQESRSD
jgi:AcrR family transcriptional regulator